MGCDLRIPLDFVPTAQSYESSQGKPRMEQVHMPQPLLNPQTIAFCDKLGLDDPLAILLGAKRKAQSSPKLSPPSRSLNDSELNITLDSSKISNNPDEVRQPDLLMRIVQFWHFY